MSDDRQNSDNPSLNRTEDLTEKTSQDITGNPALPQNKIPENTFPDNTSPESPAGITHQDSADLPAAYQTTRSSKRPAGRHTLIMTKEQLMAAIGEVTE